MIKVFFFFLDFKFYSLDKDMSYYTIVRPIYITHMNLAIEASFYLLHHIVKHKKTKRLMTWTSFSVILFFISNSQASSTTSSFLFKLVILLFSLPFWFIDMTNPDPSPPTKLASKALWLRPPITASGCLTLDPWPPLVPPVYVGQLISKCHGTNHGQASGHPYPVGFPEEGGDFISDCPSNWGFISELGFWFPCCIMWLIRLFVFWIWGFK